MEQEDGIRSYRVKTEEGVLYRRNRKHLCATNEVFNDQSEVLSGSYENQSLCNSASYISQSSQNVQVNQSSQKSVCCDKSESEKYQSNESGDISDSKCSIRDGNNVVKTNIQSTQQNDSGLYVTSKGRPVRKPKHLQDFHT